MKHSLVSVTYDASQYTPQAFEETNRHFQEACDRGDYPAGIHLICIYPTGIGSVTIVVAGSDVPETTSNAIFGEVKKALDKFPRIAQSQPENLADIEQSKDDTRSSAE